MTTYQVNIEQGDNVVPVLFPEGTAIAHVVDFAQDHPGAYVIDATPGQNPKFLFWIDEQGQAIACE